jgi:hypothetical protein
VALGELDVDVGEIKLFTDLFDGGRIVGLFFLLFRLLVAGRFRCLFSAIALLAAAFVRRMLFVGINGRFLYLIF